MNKKVFLTLLIPLLITSCNTASPKPYKLVWSDEFSGDSLDMNTWSYMIGNGAEYGNAGWGNHEIEYYREDNVSVIDGELHIKAKKESYGGFEYTSGRIRTAGKVSFLYGKIEARIKLPAERAMWPAFWMLPEDFITYGGWPMCGEVDIMEANGGSPKGSTAALHYSSPSGVHDYKVGAIGYGGRGGSNTTIADYHIYSVIWDVTKFRFYVDNSLILTVPRSTWSTSAVSKEENPNAPFDKEFHLLLNMAIGGDYVNGDTPTSTFQEADMVVDYIRVYQQ